MRRTPKLSRCLGKGFNGYIMKPYTPEMLLASVWQIMSNVPPLPGDDSPAKLEIELDKIEELPTLPTVYAEVEALCKDPNVDADKLSKVIETDPSITMKRLKIWTKALV